MSGWNLTGDKLPNEKKANKAISDVQFKSTPFNGDAAGWREDEKERERTAVKGIEDAYKKDYARFKQENPGVDCLCVQYFCGNNGGRKEGTGKSRRHETLAFNAA